MNLSVKILGLEGVVEMSGNMLKAARYAVADAASGAKAETARLLAGRWNIKRADINKQLVARVSGAKNNPERTLTISGKEIDLAYFGAIQIMGAVKVTRGKDGLLASSKVSRNQLAKGPQPAGVMVELIKGRRTLLRQAFMRNVRDFAGRAKGGALLYGEGSSGRVMARYRQKINVAASISVPSMYKQSGIHDKVEAKAQEILDRRLFYHFDRLTEKDYVK